MAVNKVPVTEKITVKQVVAEKTRQEVVRGKINVEEGKPDVSEVVSVYKTVKVDNVSVLKDKVIVDGTLTLQVIYVADDPAQPVHHTQGELPFTTYVEVPGAEPGMNVKVDVEIEDVKVTRANSRVLNVTAVLEVHAKVTETREIEVLVEIPGCKVESEEIKIKHVVGSESTQIIVEDEVNIPAEKPAAAKILDVVDTKVTITDTRVIKDKVIIDGEVVLQVLYVSAEDPAQPVHHMHIELPFSSYVEIPGVEPDMNVEVDATVESADVELAGEQVNQGFERVKAYVVLRLDVDVTETRVINIITNVLDCPFETTLLHVESVVGEDTSQVVLRDTFSPPEGKPPAQKVLDANVSEVEVTEKKVLKNKVVVRGYVDMHIIYVADTAALDQPVHSVHRQLNFRTFLEIPGAEEDMDVQVKVMAEYTKADLSNNDIHVEVVLKVTGRVIETMQKKVVTEVEIPEEKPPEVCPPGQVIEYTIKPGDTFYKLAQKYCTTVEAIKQANPGVDPLNLQIGQKIKIPCPAKG